MKKGRVKIVLLAAFGLLLLFPIYILFMSTFKTSSELFVVSLWPKSPTFDNLKAVLNSEFLNSIKNSLFVSTTVTVVAMILHSLCGYALARLDFPGKRWIFGTIVSTLMIPTTTILVPLFMVCKAFGITLAQFFTEGNSPELTEEQRLLFAKWSTLNDDQKQALLALIDTMRS